MQKKHQTNQKARAVKTRTSSTDRKLRQQQVGMAIIGIILILAMVIALIANT